MKKKSLDYLITCSKRAEGTEAVVSKPPPPKKKKIDSISAKLSSFEITQ